MTGGKFVNTDFDLETRIVGKGEGALSNIILTAQRIGVSAKNVYGNKRSSHKQIKDLIALQLTHRAVNPSRKRVALNQTRLSKGDRTSESSVLATFTETPNNSKRGTIIKYPYRINDSVLGGEL